MDKVKPKKHLGQHFLIDENIAIKIVDSLQTDQSKCVLEIGPGMGVLTQFLVEKFKNFKAIEVDNESVEFLREKYSNLEIISKDFLKLNLPDILSEQSSIIGNFPYNISSQIFFKILENKNFVDQCVCMLQKEVAERICSKHGNKVYGILSVLIQAFYTTEYLFTVNEHVFNPPPKVKSAVIRLKKRVDLEFTCDERLFFVVVKQAFSTRRKTLRNALKSIIKSADLLNNPVFDKRAEQLSINDFIQLTLLIQNN